MKSKWLLYLLAGLLIAFFINRGFWQLGRAEQKELLLQSHALALRADQPIDLSQSPAPQSPAKVSMSGRFLPQIWYLDNQRQGAAVGVRVFQLFEYSAANGARSIIPVELGWRPFLADRQLPEFDGLQGDWQLEGLWLDPPSPGLALGEAATPVSEHAWLLLRMERDWAMQQVGAAYLHQILRPDPEWPHGFIRDEQILANTLPPEKHRGYALQWFGFGAALFVIVLILSVRRHD